MSHGDRTLLSCSLACLLAWNLLTCPFTSTQNKYCKCRMKRSSVQCCKEFTCMNRCTRMRNCGRHQCKKKCCTGGCKVCPEVCNQRLNCQNHKCEMLCHPGPCFPCPVTVDIPCYCGAQVITVPCGAERDTAPPVCDLNCSIPPTCHHPSRQVQTQPRSLAAIRFGD